MICAPAAARPASVGDQGRKAASGARTAQMITQPEQSANLGVCAGGACGGSTVSRGAVASGGIAGTLVPGEALIAE